MPSLTRQEAVLDTKLLDPDGLSDIIAFYQEHPVIAAEDILDLEHGLPWHQRVALKISWSCSDVLQIWTRGAGKTWFIAMESLLAAALYPNEKIGIFSASFRQSKFVFAEIARMYDNSAILRELCVKRPIEAPDRCYLRFKNGSLIEALPLGDGQKIRGARYYRLKVDEAAAVPSDIIDIVISGMRATAKGPMDQVVRLRKLKNLIKRGIITEEEVMQPASNKITLTTTSFFRFNHIWNRLTAFVNEIEKSDTKQILVPPRLDCDEPKAILFEKDYGVAMFNYKDPPPGFMDIRAIEKNKAQMSDVKFRMEYLCYFPADSDGFFKRSKLERARNHDKFTVELIGEIEASYVLGIDPARSSDNFAMVLGRIEGDKLHIVRCLTLNNKSFAIMHEKIREFMRHYNIVRICMDAGGGGMAIYDMLSDPEYAKDLPLIWDVNDEDNEEREGLHILELIKFSDDSIPTMAFKMQSYLDNDILRLPCIPARFYKNAEDNWLSAFEDEYREIDWMIEEASNIVSGHTRTGRVRLGLPSEMGEKTVGVGEKRLERKDRFTALMLACWAYNQAGLFSRERAEQVEIAFGLPLIISPRRSRYGI